MINSGFLHYCECWGEKGRSFSWSDSVLSQVRAAVHDVAVRQARLEEKVRRIESGSSTAAAKESAAATH